MDNVMVIAVITPDEAMKELDRDLEKTCEIMGLLYHNYGIVMPLSSSVASSAVLILPASISPTKP